MALLYPLAIAAPAPRCLRRSWAPPKTGSPANPVAGPSTARARSNDPPRLKPRSISRPKLLDVPWLPANLQPAAPDYIIATGAVPHQAIPTTAVLIEDRLGLAGSGIPAFTSTRPASAFSPGWTWPVRSSPPGAIKLVLVVACDLPSRGTTWEEPDVKVLFGDGAAAAILRRSDDPETGVLALDRDVLRGRRDV